MLQPTIQKTTRRDKWRLSSTGSADTHSFDPINDRFSYFLPSAELKLDLVDEPLMLAAFQVAVVRPHPEHGGSAGQRSRADPVLSVWPSFSLIIPDLNK